MNKVKLRRVRQITERTEWMSRGLIPPVVKPGPHNAVIMGAINNFNKSQNNKLHRSYFLIYLLSIC